MSEPPKRKVIWNIRHAYTKIYIIPNIYQINLFALSAIVSIRTTMEKMETNELESGFAEFQQNISTTM